MSGRGVLAHSQAAWQSVLMPQRRDSSLLYLLKRVEMAARKRLDAVVEAAGITAVQYSALTSLERQPGLTAAALARHSFVTAQTTAQLVHGLEGRGLIAREPDPQSRRQVLLHLTADGMRLLDDLRGPVADIQDQMTSGLTADELARVRRGLESFRAAVEPDRPTPVGVAER